MTTIAGWEQLLEWCCPFFMFLFKAMRWCWSSILHYTTHLWFLSQSSLKKFNLTFHHSNHNPSLILPLYCQPKDCTISKQIICNSERFSVVWFSISRQPMDILAHSFGTAVASALIQKLQAAIWGWLATPWSVLICFDILEVAKSWGTNLGFLVNSRKRSRISMIFSWLMKYHSVEPDEQTFYCFLTFDGWYALLHHQRFGLGWYHNDWFLDGGSAHLQILILNLISTQYTFI